jgi:hypothetical protein
MVDIETISNASEFLEDTLTYGIMTMPWNVVSEKGQLLLNGFIKESTNSCGHSLSIRSCLMFLISLLKSFFLLLTYDRGSTDQTMNDSPFHMMWVVGRSADNDPHE